MSEVRVRIRLTVDPNGTGVDLVSSDQSLGDVPREDGAGQTVFGVVGHLHNFLGRRELDQDDDRAKDFLLDDLHVRSGVGEDGRLNKVSLVAESPATEVTGGTFGLSGVDVAHDSLRGRSVRH